MEASTLTKLIALGGAATLALVAVWALLRLERRSDGPAELRAGYPPEHYPDRQRVGTAPLAGLSESQTRLLRLYRSLPRSSELEGELRVFLGELRALMDGAYQLAGLPSSTRTDSRLAQLLEEVRDVERAMTERTARRLEAVNVAPVADELQVRVSVMRALAHEPDDP